MQRLSVVPLVGALAVALGDEEEGEAKRRQNRRHSRHRHQGHPKHKKGHCKSKAKVCAGQCGAVDYVCEGRKTQGKKRKKHHKTADCGSCSCSPACGACFTCDAATKTCVVDASQVGQVCGGAGQTCQADGTCGSGAACPTPCTGTTACCNGACVDTNTDLANCGGCGQTCTGGTCTAGVCGCDAGFKNCNGNCIAQDACCGVCVQLTWTTPNADLDSHGWAGDGTEVWYQDLGSVSSSPFMALDVDDQDPPGFEQISIARLLPGTTFYAVNNFTECTGGGTTMVGSNASVHVTRDGADLGTFPAPATGSGPWWTVFSMDASGTLTPINTIGNTPPVTSGQVCT
jgi:hypothetical protein